MVLAECWGFSDVPFSLSGSQRPFTCWPRVRNDSKLWKQDSAEDRSQLPKPIYPNLFPVQWHITGWGVLLFEVEWYSLCAPLISIKSYKIGGQITTKVLLYSSGNYIQYLIITSNEKESEKEYKYIYIITLLYAWN